LVKVLFVCTGNICRSPTADGVMRDRVAELDLTPSIDVDSAGTQGFHAGEPPDHRSQRTALKHGVDLSDLRARKIAALDFETFDIIAAMDRGHLDALRRLCPAPFHDRLHLFMDFAEGYDGPDEVPDPYYGEHGFEEVFSMVEHGVGGLIAHIRRRYGV
jgi:protein-tyrosine phosphatase